MLKDGGAQPYPLRDDVRDLAGLAVEARRAAGEPAIECITRPAHSEALMVRDTVYDVVHLDQPRVSLPLSAHLRLTRP